MTEENRQKANELSDKIRGSENSLKHIRSMIAAVGEGRELYLHTHGRSSSEVTPSRFSEAFLRLVEQEHERLITGWKKEIEAL